jgi:hypothetical protein
MKSRKVIAIYYPQYHALPINDKHWGKGFTDWQNVQKARPLFPGHQQPKTPLNNHYYNPCEVETLRGQAELAKKYGVYGFCFYHYWFDGKPLLEKPLLHFLQAKNIDMPFCLSWANETWSKRWVGDKTIIIKQNHTPEKQIWEAHFQFLLPFFKDSRAIKIDHKPVFLLYQPFIINQINEMLTFWQELALKNGLPGIYFIATKRHAYFPEDCLQMINGIMKFQPSNARNSKNFKSRSLLTNPHIQKIRGWGEHLIDLINAVRSKWEGVKHIRSEEIWETILKDAADESPSQGKDIFEGAYINWDNTARYGKKATIYSHVSPEQFKQYLTQLFRQLEQKKPSNIIFMNAWNEWAEGAYLEPDEQYGFAYLEKLKEVISEQ